MNNRKTPRIRFKGFTDDWEQRKLLELVTKYEDPVETPHDGYIRLGIRSHAKGTFHEYVEPGHELETAQMHRVATNKLIFNITFAWEHAVAIANENDAGKLVSHRFPQFTLSESLRPEFLKYVILDEGFHHNLYLASPGGAGRNRVLKIKEALDYPIYYPSLEEQHKIGEFITNLDHLITLHQRKLEKLKIVKKAMLENCFPKNGEKVPKFRFSGFTGDWEQRKLGEILSERINKTSDFESNPLYSLTIENGVTPKTERYERDFLVRKSEDLFKIVNPNEFVTNPMNLRFGALGYNKNAFKVSVSGYYDVFSIDNNECSSFWKSYFNTSASLRYFDNVATGTLIEKRRVKYSTLREMEFYKPLTIDEKKKIGMYCESLDHLITLHQRKLEKLKIIKKSFLEKMFV